MIEMPQKDPTIFFAAAAFWTQSQKAAVSHHMINKHAAYLQAIPAAQK